MEEFDIRNILPFTLGYAQRHPHEMESTVADKINTEVNYAIRNALTADRTALLTELREWVEENTEYVNSDLEYVNSDQDKILAHLDELINPTSI